MLKSELIQVRIDKKLKQKLKDKAFRKGMDLSDYVRSKLIESLEIDMNEIFKMFLLIYRKILKMYLELVSGQALILKTIVHKEITPKEALENRVKAFHARWKDLVTETEDLLQK